jgi:hypothetical protein
MYRLVYVLSFLKYNMVRNGGWEEENGREGVGRGWLGEGHKLCLELKNP